MRVALALVLLDQRQGSAKVLLQRTIAAEARLSGSEAPAIAEAMKTALTEVLRQTETVIAAAVR